ALITSSTPKWQKKKEKVLYRWGRVANQRNPPFDEKEQ
ncbi:hypothetical protein CEXT_179791, partial [Caerostris extrusa]